MSNYRRFKDLHIEQLRDPEDAKIYLSVALEDYEKDERYRSIPARGA